MNEIRLNKILNRIASETPLQIVETSLSSVERLINSLLTADFTARFTLFFLRDGKVLLANNSALWSCENLQLYGFNLNEIAVSIEYTIDPEAETVQVSNYSHLEHDDNYHHALNN